MFSYILGACTGANRLLILGLIRKGNNTDMSRRIFLKPLMVVAVVGALLLGLSLTAKAATGGNGLRVSPVRTDLEIQPGQTKTVTINVTNVTSVPATLQTIINDFTANKDESGNPSILLDANQYASSHSLKRYAQPGGQFTLQPGQQKSVPIVITMPKNVAGGGYFGAVRFAPAGAQTKGPNQTVSLAGSVGSLILVKVPGDIKESLNIASFNSVQDNRVSSLFFNNKNVNAVVRFQNTGNVQLQPFGKILLRSSNGKILYQANVNNTNPPGNVLPDSIRKFPVPLKNVGTFGKFKIEGNFGYGTNGQLLSASSTFYVIPALYIWIAFGLVLLILFLIFILPKLIRSYNQRVIRRAGRR